MQEDSVDNFLLVLDWNTVNIGAYNPKIKKKNKKRKWIKSYPVEYINSTA